MPDQNNETPDLEKYMEVCHSGCEVSYKDDYVEPKDSFPAVLDDSELLNAMSKYYMQSLFSLLHEP